MRNRLQGVALNSLSAGYFSGERYLVIKKYEIIHFLLKLLFLIHKPVELSIS